MADSGTSSPTMDYQTWKTFNNLSDSSPSVANTNQQSYQTYLNSLNNGAPTISPNLNVPTANPSPTNQPALIASNLPVSTATPLQSNTPSTLDTLLNTRMTNPNVGLSATDISSYMPQVQQLDAPQVKEATQALNQQFANQGMAGSGANVAAKNDLTAKTLSQETSTAIQLAQGNSAATQSAIESALNKQLTLETQSDTQQWTTNATQAQEDYQQRLTEAANGYVDMYGNYVKGTQAIMSKLEADYAATQTQYNDAFQAGQTAAAQTFQAKMTYMQDQFQTQWNNADNATKSQLQQNQLNSSIAGGIISAIGSLVGM